MTSMMRAVFPSGPGGPEVLTCGERPIPQMSDRDVLIKVAYAGVNRHDCNQRQRGMPPAGATDILGLEVSGTIVACGPQAKTYSVGTKVCALVNGGGYAEYVVAQDQLILPVPSKLELREAASLPEAMFTAWHNLVDLCSLADKDIVLIHGGASGVGTMAIQLARSLGARVFATAGTDERCAFAENLGAERCFNYRTQDFVDALLKATHKQGANIILDMAGGLYAAKNLQALAMRGRISHLSSGQEPTYTAPLALIMQKEALVTGSLLRPLAQERKAAIAQALREKIWPKIGTDIAPVIDHEFSLNQASEAHRRMEAGLNKGKILLRIL